MYGQSGQSAADELELTPDQKKKIQIILLKQEEEQRKMMAEARRGIKGNQRGQGKRRVKPVWNWE